MKFKRLDAAMKASKQHLTDTGGFGTVIESHLVAHLLVVTYAEFEEVLQKIIRTRVQRSSTDVPVYRFIQSFLKRNVAKLGRISLSDLGGTLERFGTSCKTDFYNEVENQPPHQSWDSIVANRHAVAHPGGQVQMSFTDFERAYHESVAVIRAFARACGLTADEIASL